MVVKIKVVNFLACKVLLDNGSSTDVLYWPTFKQLGIPESQTKPFLEQLIGFARETSDTIGYVHLLTTFGDETWSQSIMIKYRTFDALTAYIILIGHPLLNELGTIISNPHLAMKFPSEDGKIIIFKVNQMTAREYYVANLMISKGKNVAEPKVQLVASNSLNNNLGEAELNLREQSQEWNPLKK